MATCPHCGASLPAFPDAFCPSCRQELPQEIASPEPAAEGATPTPNRRLILAGCVCGILGGILGVAEASRMIAISIVIPAALMLTGAILVLVGRNPS